MKIEKITGYTTIILVSIILIVGASYDGIETSGTFNILVSLFELSFLISCLFFIKNTKKAAEKKFFRIFAGLMFLFAVSVIMYFIKIQPDFIFLYTFDVLVLISFTVYLVKESGTGK